MMEMKKHKTGCMLSLTYRENPTVLVKEDAQKFLKRLRKALAPQKIRYLLCGEYGPKTLRPHFHIVLFGYDFPNKTLWKKTAKGFPLYRDDFLTDTWGHGLATISALTKETASYCALYASKGVKDLPPN